MTPDGQARVIELLEAILEAAQPRPSLMDAADVARELRVSERTVYRLNQLGELPPPVRIGALVRWRRADLDQFLLGAQS